MSADRAIIFDLDDTLYLERDYALSGYRVIATGYRDQLGGDVERAVAVMREVLEHGDRRQVFDEALARLGKGPDPLLVRKMVETYRSHAPQIRLCPDATRALARLRDTARLGLISDGPLIQQSAKVRALALSAALDPIILTDAFGPGFGKPHTRAFVELAERVGVSPDRCTYVADNPAKDFVAPNALGWRTIRIRRPESIYRDQSAAPAGEPQHTIISLDVLT